MQFLSEYVYKSIISLMKGSTNSNTFRLGCMWAVAQISPYLGRQISLPGILQEGM